jgi:chromosome segregation ATPase
MTKTTALLAGSAVLQILAAADLFRFHFLLYVSNNALVFFILLSILFNVALLVYWNECDKSSAEAEKAKAEAEELQKEAKRLNATIEHQKAYGKELSQHYTKLLANCTAQASELGKLRGSVEGMAGSYSNLKTAFASSLDKIQQHYISSLDDQLEQISNLNEALSNARRKSRQTAAEKAALEEKVKSLKQELSSIRTERGARR